MPLLTVPSRAPSLKVRRLSGEEQYKQYIQLRKIKDHFIFTIGGWVGGCGWVGGWVRACFCSCRRLPRGVTEAAQHRARRSPVAGARACERTLHVAPERASLGRHAPRASPGA